MTLHLSGNAIGQRNISRVVKEGSTGNVSSRLDEQFWPTIWVQFEVMYDVHIVHSTKILAKPAEYFNHTFINGILEVFGLLFE